MKFEATPNQALVLFGMLFARTPEQRQPMLTKARPDLTAEERAALVEAGLIELRERGRATHLVATSAAWDWANTHLGVALSRSSSAGPVLHDVLSRLGAFLSESGLALSDIVAVSDGSDSSSAKMASS